MINISRTLTIEESRNMELENWVAISIDKNEIHRVIRTNKAYNFAIPSYLKGVKKIAHAYYILVIKFEDSKLLLKTDILEEIQNYLQNIYKSKIHNIQIIKVPSFKPLTFNQYQQAILYWPCQNQIVNHKLPSINMECYLKLENNKNNNVCSGYGIFYDSTNKKMILEITSKNELFGHGIFNGVKEISKVTEDYLCNELELYIQNEPCIACAMALVHGRIGSVFYLNEKDPYSFSRLKINYLRNINHRFNVYKIEKE